MRPSVNQLPDELAAFSVELDSDLSQAERVLGLALANAQTVESLENSLNEEYTKLSKEH